MEGENNQPIAGSCKRSHHQWTRQEDKVLIDISLELVNNGWKADNGFKSGYLGQMQKMMAERIKDCKIRGDPNIKSRLRTYKKEYREVRLMKATSGFGWDDTTKTISCEDNIWNTWVKHHKEAAGLRNKPIPYFDSLAAIFGKDQATGEGAESAVETVELEETMRNTALDDYFQVDVEMDRPTESVFGSKNVPTQSSSGTSKRSRMMGDDSTGRPRKGKKKGSPEPHEEALLANMEKISAVCDATRVEIAKVGAYFENINAKMVNRNMLYDMVTKTEGLTKEEAITAYGIISADRNKSDSFLMIPYEEAKLIYLKGILSRVI